MDSKVIYYSVLLSLLYYNFSSLILLLSLSIPVRKGEIVGVFCIVSGGFFVCECFLQNALYWRITLYSQKKDHFCYIINYMIMYLPDAVNDCDNKSKSVQKSR